MDSAFVKHRYLCARNYAMPTVHYIDSSRPTPNLRINVTVLILRISSSDRGPKEGICTLSCV